MTRLSWIAFQAIVFVLTLWAYIALLEGEYTSREFGIMIFFAAGTAYVFTFLLGVTWDGLCYRLFPWLAGLLRPGNKRQSDAGIPPARRAFAHDLAKQRQRPRAGKYPR